MRKLGETLMVLGAAIGTTVAAALLFDIGMHSLPWLASIGLIKLTFASAVGLIGCGAFVRRMAIRSEQRERLAAGTDKVDTT